jgi:hypothetical protein
MEDRRPKPRPATNRADPATNTALEEEGEEEEEEDIWRFVQRLGALFFSTTDRPEKVITQS